MNIIEIELLSDSLAETEKFYRNVLGLAPYYKEDNAFLFFKIGGTELIFKKSDNVKPVYHFAIEVPNNRFFDAHNYIKQRTAIIMAGDDEIVNFANWDAKSFYFYDNNGNIVEVITRYPTRNYDAEPFSNKTYISISEIGLVTGEVSLLADTLIKEEGLPVFKRQPRHDEFIALGNDEGLILLSSRGRNWFPTSVAAQRFPVRVMFMEEANVGHILR